MHEEGLLKPEKSKRGPSIRQPLTEVILVGARTFGFRRGASIAAGHPYRRWLSFVLKPEDAMEATASDSMRTPMEASALMGLLAILDGCNTLRPLSTQRTLDGYPAKATSILVLDAYSFKPDLVAHTLPAGTYTPALEDDNGIYFQSSSKLLLGELSGPTLHDGGLFFKGGILIEAYDYMMIGGRHSNWKLPKDFKFRVDRKPSVQR